MVSVVITTCGREPDILRRAIDSVLCQTYSDWELIVVDDSPQDYVQRDEIRQTVETIGRSAEGSRIRYIAHEVNRGACAARNTGLAAAGGEYIAYLDDDDEWLPEKLNIQVQKAREAGPDVALIYCGSYVQVDGTDQVVLRKQVYCRGYIFDSLILENYIGSTSFPLMRTECLREIGGFDILMQSAQDADVWLRLAARYQIDYVEDPLVCYHRHGGARITTNVEKKIAGMERLNEKNQAYLSEHPQAFCIRNMKLACVYAKGGKFGKALRTWGKGAAKCPWKFIQNGKYMVRLLREELRAVRR